MLDTVFHLVKLYNSPEVGKVQQGFWRLTLALAGIDSWKVTLPDGREIVAPPEYPWLALIPPKAVTQFEIGIARQNWAVSFESEGLRFDNRSGRILLRSGRDWLSVPAFTAVPIRRRESMLSLFESMSAEWRKGTPESLFRARLALSSILADMLDLAREPAKPSPEEKFRDAIDADAGCHFNLAVLAQKSGVSLNHLRLQFQKRFHLSPVQYRNRRRLQTAMELISGSGQNLASIAEQTGFLHLSHLSAAFRRHYGITLREALRRYRQ